MMHPSEAFQIAVPRRPAVLCLKRGKATEMIATNWFTWLNLKNQPMISYAMERSAEFGLDLKSNDKLYLAFPAREEAEKYKGGLKALPGQGEAEGEDPQPICMENLPVMVPVGSEIVLKCTLVRAYNYPFKKVRIFNCNFEGAVTPSK